MNNEFTNAVIEVALDILGRKEANGMKVNISPTVIAEEMSKLGFDTMTKSWRPTVKREAFNDILDVCYDNFTVTVRGNLRIVTL